MRLRCCVTVCCASFRAISGVNGAVNGSGVSSPTMQGSYSMNASPSLGASQAVKGPNSKARGPRSSPHSHTAELQLEKVPCKPKDKVSSMM